MSFQDRCNNMSEKFFVSKAEQSAIGAKQAEKNEKQPEKAPAKQKEKSQ